MVEEEEPFITASSAKKGRGRARSASDVSNSSAPETKKSKRGAKVEEDKMEVEETEQLTVDTIKAMKVSDLKTHLEAKGLSSKGLKGELVERLLETL